MSHASKVTRAKRDILKSLRNRASQRFHSDGLSIALESVEGVVRYHLNKAAERIAIEEATAELLKPDAFEKDINA